MTKRNEAVGLVIVGVVVVALIQNATNQRAKSLGIPSAYVGLAIWLAARVLSQGTA